jgi:hypothetical protein
MRTIFVLPLSALVAAVAGCGPEARESGAHSVPQRDLTLVTQTSEAKTASPLETQRPQVQHRTVRHLQRTARPAAVAPRLAVPAPVPAASQPVVQPPSSATAPANDRELLPGKTVTVIPVSTGASTSPDETDDLPAAPGRKCRGRGRGPGIGIATAPRPDFR